MLETDPLTPRGDTPSLRELNKERTRRALADAAYALAVSHGLTAVTAESVAQAAGVSRRTFFNYYPSVAAVLSWPVEEFLDRARAKFTHRPAGEPIHLAAVEIFAEAAEPELMRRVAEMSRLFDGSPEAAHLQLESWASAEAGLAQVIVEQSLECGCFAPEDARLRAEIIAASLLGGVRAGLAHWLRADTGGTDEPSLQRLTDTLAHALRVLADTYGTDPTTVKDN